MSNHRPVMSCLLTCLYCMLHINGDGHEDVDHVHAQHAKVLLERGQIGLRVGKCMFT